METVKLILFKPQMFKKLQIIGFLASENMFTSTLTHVLQLVTAVAKGPAWFCEGLKYILFDTRNQ